jgi:hypothetical protein
VLFPLITRLRQPENGIIKRNTAHFRLCWKLRGFPTCAPEGPFPHYIGLIGGGRPREIAPGTCGAQACFVNEPLAAYETNDDVEYALRQFPDIRIARTDVKVSIFPKTWRFCYVGKRLLVRTYHNSSNVQEHLNAFHQSTSSKVQFIPG